MTTYYIRPSGEDRQSGTSAKQAWRTLQRASQTQYAPGDRLLLEKGVTFNGTLTLNVIPPGTPDLPPMMVGTFGRGRATIDAGRGAGIVIANTGGIRIQNLNIVGIGRANGNEKNGVSLWMDQPGDVRLTGIRIENVTVRGFGDCGVSIGAEPVDQSRSGYKGIRLTNVEAYDNGDAGIVIYAHFRTDIPGWAHEDVSIRRCRAYRNRGIADKGAHSGNGIVISQVDGAVIEKCTAYENGENSNYNGGGPIGIWAWDSNRVIIEHCKSYGNRSRTLDGGGFDLDGGVTNSIMRHNKSRNNAGAGFMIYQFGGARPCFRCIVHNNVSENDGRTNLGGLFAGGGIQGAIFHDNRVIVGPRDGMGEAYAAGVDERDNGEVIFRSNQLTTKRGAPLIHVPTLRGKVRFLDNTYRAEGPFVILWNTIRHATLNAFRTATGQESEIGD
jgi:hypothetical protein